MDQISFSNQSPVTIAGFSQIQQQGNFSTSQSEGDKQNRQDRVTLSEEGKSLSAENQKNGVKQLTESELRLVEDLKARDREVRAHEQAHLVAAGPHAQGGPKYEMTKGPDGRSYATGGHVSVDISKENTPEATVAKMRTIRKAALAPANPSSADRQIAAQASMMEQQAIAEINQASIEESRENTQEINSEEDGPIQIETETTENRPNNNTGGYVAQFQQNDSGDSNKPISIIA